jgi:hypothetical protein
MATVAGTCLGARRKDGELGDGRSGRQTPIRSIDVNWYFAGHLVHTQALGGCPALTVRHYGETLCPIGEFPGGTICGQGKHNGGAGDWFVILILHPDNWFASGTLANIVYGAFAFHDDNIEFGWHRLRVQRRKSD